MAARYACRKSFCGRGDMSESDLDFIASFLDAAGYRTRVDRRGTVDAERNTKAGPRRLRVWAPDAVPSSASAKDILANCTAIRAAKPPAEAIVVLSQPSEFAEAARAVGARVRTLAQFLDDPYQQEGGSIGIESRQGEGRGRAVARYLLQLRKPWLLGADHAKVLPERTVSKTDWTKGRVPQPYRWIEGRPAVGGADAPADALDHLLANVYRPPAQPHIDLVVGNAGVGKSDLFDALFTYVYSHFQNAKRGNRWTVRPSAVTPGRILRTSSISSGDLFSAIVETEAVGAVSARLFDWYMASGNMLLMFDGLDEFFADQTDFYATIEQRFLKPQSRARLLIVLRDSLLLNPHIQDLLGRIRSNAALGYSLIEVTKWGEAATRPAAAHSHASAIRSFAWIRYEGRVPAPSEPDPPKVRKFLAVAENKGAASLFSLPFYCQCLFEWLEERSEPPANKLALLEFVLARLIRREWDKIRQGREESSGSAPTEAAFATRGDLFDRLVFNVFVRFKTSLPVRVLDTALGTHPASADDERSADAYARGRQRLDGEIGLSRLLEDTAFSVRRTVPGQEGEGRQLDLDTLAELYRRERPIDLTGQQRKDGQRVFQKLAIFEHGEGQTLAFTHEILADYLAAKAAVRRLKEDHRKAPEIAIGLPSGTATEVFDEVLALALASEPWLAENFGTAADRSDSLGFKRIAYGILESCMKIARPQLPSRASAP
jgi:hypothetical protein